MGPAEKENLWDKCLGSWVEEVNEKGFTEFSRFVDKFLAEQEEEYEYEEESEDENEEEEEEEYEEEGEDEDGDGVVTDAQ